MKTTTRAFGFVASFTSSSLSAADATGGGGGGGGGDGGGSAKTRKRYRPSSIRTQRRIRISPDRYQTREENEQKTKR